jgi:hypothetical protein
MVYIGKGSCCVQLAQLVQLRYEHDLVNAFYDNLNTHHPLHSWGLIHLKAAAIPTLGAHESS